ncbi:hypothetical protein HID58_077491 [Brassica napus]|uniref:Calmodulin-binding domain-containing protein n=1 Tax=Brassica napus TaxID=3708 RepID=A0ABQ7YQH9_BRANA|nr:hypothetical protein HID58_077491 [Brassica napus]
MAVENSSEIKNCAMAEENNTSEVKEIDTNPQEMTMSEEGSVRRIIVKDVGNVEDVALKDQDKCVSKTKEVPKPPSVSSRRHSTGAIGTLAGGKLEVKSRYRGNHHVPSTHDLCKHEGKLGDHRDDAVKPWKVNEGTESTVSGGGSSVAKKVLGLGSEKSSSKVYTPKTKEKAKNQTISGEDVKEKTVCIVEASVKGVQTSSEKKSMRSRLKSLATPTKRGSAKKVPELEAKKIRPTKKIGVKVTPAKQLSFKKGKTLEPKLLEEQETQSEGRKKNLKGVVGETKSVSCEGSKREKVVLRRRKVEGKKKRMTLFNSVIEETMNKLIKVRKTKVKALTGAFEFVISLQDTNKTPHSKDVTSESKVSPLGSKQ